MEYYWTTVNNNNNNNSNGSNSSTAVRGHNGNFSHHHHAWEVPCSSDPLTNSSPNYAADGSASRQLQVEASEYHALMLHHYYYYYKSPDPHLTCLKLGKRQYYFGDEGGHVAAAEEEEPSKKGKPESSSAARCQVEGCGAVLVNAKEYHRRHKVCEMHAKAPRVVVNGVEQRFCQQCSRFHGVGEFDEAKRSCRRRLAGHNERRRKTSSTSTQPQDQHHNSQIPKNKSNSQGRHPHLQMNSSECALSLLSSSSTNIQASADLPARCSAALHELIAENRACRHHLINAAYKQINDHDFNNNNSNYKLDSVRPGSNRGHLTLDLMQAPNSAFGLLSVHDHHKSSNERDRGEEECSDELWKVHFGY